MILMTLMLTDAVSPIPSCFHLPLSICTLSWMVMSWKTELYFYSLNSFLHLMHILGRRKEENINTLGHSCWLKPKMYLGKSPAPRTAISTGIAEVGLVMASRFEQYEALGLCKLKVLFLFLIILDYDIPQLNLQCSCYVKMCLIFIRLSFVHFWTPLNSFIHHLLEKLW